MSPPFALYALPSALSACRGLRLRSCQPLPRSCRRVPFLWQTWQPSRLPPELSGSTMGQAILMMPWLKNFVPSWSKLFLLPRPSRLKRSPSRLRTLRQSLKLKRRSRKPLTNENRAFQPASLSAEIPQPFRLAEFSRWRFYDRGDDRGDRSDSRSGRSRVPGC